MSDTNQPDINAGQNNSVPSPEITRIGENEYSIDTTRCHGLGMEGGTLSDLLPDASTIATSVTSLTADQIRNGMVDALKDMGGELPIGGKALLHFNSAGPGAILDIALSVKEEGIVQATLSTGAGTMTDIIVTGLVSSTPFAPVAPIAGIVAGNLANTGVDWAITGIKELLEDRDSDYEIKNNSQDSSEPSTISYDMASGTLLSSLSLESNLKIINSLSQQGEIVNRLESGEGISLANLQGDPAVEVLYNADDTPSVIIDPATNLSIEYNKDGGGEVVSGPENARKSTPFNKGDLLTIDYQADANDIVTVTPAKTFETTSIGNPDTAFLAPEQGSQPTTYTIQQGDTLSELAEANNTTVENILYFNLEIDDPDKIHAGDELIIPPEGWELPELEPIRDADGNIILLASNESEMAADILAARAETTEEDQPEEADKPIPDGEDVDKAYIDFMQSQIGLRDAINSGDSWDIAREGVGFVSGFDDYADALTNDDGFLDRSQEAVFDGIEHSIGLGQAIDDGDGWEIAGNSIDLLLAMELGLDANQACAYERAF